jgi:hypothetical protein
LTWKMWKKRVRTVYYPRDVTEFKH